MFRLVLYFYIRLLGVDGSRGLCAYRCSIIFWWRVKTNHVVNSDYGRSKYQQGRFKRSRTVKTEKNRVLMSDSLSFIIIHLIHSSISDWPESPRKFFMIRCVDRIWKSWRYPGKWHQQDRTGSCVNLGPVQTSIFSCTEPKSLQFRTWRDRLLNQLIPTYPEFGSTHELRSSGPHGNFDCGVILFQTSIFSYAEANA